MKNSERIQLLINRYLDWKNWVRASLAKDSEGAECDPLASTACRFCLDGAILRDKTEERVTPWHLLNHSHFALCVEIEERTREYYFQVDHDPLAELLCKAIRKVAPAWYDTVQGIGVRNSQMLWHFNDNFLVDDDICDDGGNWGPQAKMLHMLYVAKGIAETEEAAE